MGTTPEPDPTICDEPGPARTDKSEDVGSRVVVSVTAAMCDRPARSARTRTILTPASPDYDRWHRLADSRDETGARG
ncbi:MAG: hypothetical protein IPO50_12840 [Sphingomonadales bacterium]|nr:hypothetical protein [Sphingomonadales bacterium]